MSRRSSSSHRSRPIAPTIDAGHIAPPLPVGAGQRRVVAFLRHAGCPFSEATMRRLRAISLARPDILFIAVVQTNEADTAKWLAQVSGGGRVMFIYDPERTRYAAWGLGMSSIGYFAGPRPVLALIRLLFRGIRNRRIRGSRYQISGAFAIGERDAVRWRHIPEHAGALPDFDAAVAALDAIPGANE